MRKFRGGAKSAIRLVEHLQCGVNDFLNDLGRELAGFAGKGLRMRNRSFHEICLFKYVTIFLTECICDCQQHSTKAWPPVVILRRKISASVEWPTVWGQETGQRLAALPADGLHGNLVAAVDIGALIPVH